MHTAEREECPPLPAGGATAEREERGRLGPTGCGGKDIRRTGRDERQLRLAEGGGPAAPGKGEKGAGRNRQQKESDFVYFVKAFF